MMDIELLSKLLGGLVAAAVAIGGMIKYIQSRHDKALKDHKEGVDKTLEDHKYIVDKTLEESRNRISEIDLTVSSDIKSFGHRLSEVEGEIKHLPDKNDIGRLFARLDEVNGNIQKVAGGQESLSTQVGLINEHLINRERKA